MTLYYNFINYVINKIYRIKLYLKTNYFTKKKRFFFTHLNVKKQFDNIENNRF